MGENNLYIHNVDPVDLDPQFYFAAHLLFIINQKSDINNKIIFIASTSSFKFIKLSSLELLAYCYNLITENFTLLIF